MTSSGIDQTSGWMSPSSYAWRTKSTMSRNRGLSGPYWYAPARSS